MVSYDDFEVECYKKNWFCAGVIKWHMISSEHDIHMYGLDGMIEC